MMFAGEWSNEAGDKLHLVQCGTRITGTYSATKAASAEPCRSKIVVGSVSDRTICFVTGAATPRMIRSWVGQLAMGRGPDDEIHAICHAIERLTDDLDIARSQEIVRSTFRRMQDFAIEQAPARSETAFDACQRETLS